MYKLGYSIDELVAAIPEQQIYSYYIGPIKVGMPMHSPLRPKDNNPSFSIFYSSKNNKLMYKDFGTGESGDCIQFVRNLLRLNTTKEAKNKIISDLGSNTLPVAQTFKFEPIIAQERAKLLIEEQPFTKIDIAYWESYSVSIPTLIHFNIVSVRKLYINDRLTWVYTDDNPIYGYKIGDTVKCYRPFGGKGNKFRTNCSIYNIQGYEQLPKKGELLIITKAMKDVAVLYELGFAAIAPGSEGANIPADIMVDLQLRFKKSIILYDNDSAGVLNALKLSKMYNIPTLFIPEQYNSKDISDLQQLWKDKNKTKQLITDNVNQIFPANLHAPS